MCYGLVMNFSELPEQEHLIKKVVLKVLEKRVKDFKTHFRIILSTKEAVWPGLANVSFHDGLERNKKSFVQAIEKPNCTIIRSLKQKPTSSVIRSSKREFSNLQG